VSLVTHPSPSNINPNFSGPNSPFIQFLALFGRNILVKDNHAALTTLSDFTFRRSVSFNSASLANWTASEMCSFVM